MGEGGVTASLDIDVRSPDIPKVRPILQQAEDPRRQRTFLRVLLPGFPCMTPVARAAVRNALTKCPRREDAEHIVAEFVTTAIRFSFSRGVEFEVSLDTSPGRLRIEVKDGGAFGYPPPKPPEAPVSLLHPWITLYEEDHQRDRPGEIEEYGYGLAIVNAFCDRWGHSAYPDYSIWWAELSWPDPTG